MRILINGNPGPLEPDGRGLHEGGPLSPGLFTLVIDTLNSLLQHAVRKRILRRLTTRQTASSISLFMDDEVVFSHPNQAKLKTIQDLL